MQDSELGGGGSGGGKQDGSRMIVVCIRVCVATRGGSGGCPRYEFRCSQIASDAIWDKLDGNACVQ